jgi:hypothetical protein
MADFSIPPNPTNNDIMLILVHMNSTLEIVRLQAEKTNGRVNKLEEWQTGLQAVALFQEKHPANQQTVSAPNAKTVVMQAPKWFQNDRLVSALVIAVSIAAGVIGTIYSAYTSGAGK